MTPLRAVVALLGTAALAAMFAGSTATADVAGPDDSIQQAFGPLQPATWYAGAFKSDGDVDYLTIGVAEPNLVLHVDVENTVSPCQSMWLNGCPVWGTLIDAQGTQVGGEGSAAGTAEVDAGASDVIDWTFATAGTYYLAMDSAGDLPTYRVRQVATVPAAPGPGSAAGGGQAGGSGTPPAPGSPGSGAGAGTSGGEGSGSSPPLPATSLVVASPQRGTAVRARLLVRRALRRLTVTVGRPGGPALASLRLTSVRAGRRHVALRLGPAGRLALARAGRLRLTVRLVAVPSSGRRLVLRRGVILDRSSSR
jgi:hypothetical protein